MKHMNVNNFLKMVDNLLSDGHFVKSAEAGLKIVRTQVIPEDSTNLSAEAGMKMVRTQVIPEDGTNLALKLSETLATMPGRHFEGVA